MSKFAASPAPPPTAARGEITALPSSASAPRTTVRIPTINAAQGATLTMKSFPPFGRAGAFANHVPSVSITVSKDCVCAIIISPPLPCRSKTKAGFRHYKSIIWDLEVKGYLTIGWRVFFIFSWIGIDLSQIYFYYAILSIKSRPNTNISGSYFGNPS